MKIQGIEFMSPAKNGGKYNEAEIVGSAVWLWMQSETHREIALSDLSCLLMPAIKLGQFVLAVEKGIRVQRFRGSTYSPLQAKQWFRAHPVAPSIVLKQA